MTSEHLFSGSAIAAVSLAGAVVLPPFVLRTARRRDESSELVLTAHDSDPCVAAYDARYRRVIGAEVERRRLRDEALGLVPDTHHARARRAFGLAETAEYDGAGVILLPPMIRRIGRIDELALFVGTGGTFEIWNPEAAQASADPALSEIASWRLDEITRSQAMEDPS